MFEVYPEAIATLPGSQVWSFLFFITLIMLGMDSAVKKNEFAIPVPSFIYSISPIQFGYIRVCLSNGAARILLQFLSFIPPIYEFTGK